VTDCCAAEFTQECASNGLGLVYQCGDETMKKACKDAPSCFVPPVFS
jgi:hypothetical protein